MQKLTAVSNIPHIPLPGQFFSVGLNQWSSRFWLLTPVALVSNSYVTMNGKVALFLMFSFEMLHLLVPPLELLKFLVLNLHLVLFWLVFNHTIFWLLMLVWASSNFIILVLLDKIMYCPSTLLGPGYGLGWWSSFTPENYGNSVDGAIYHSWYCF